MDHLGDILKSAAGGALGAILTAIIFLAWGWLRRKTLDFVKKSAEIEGAETISVLQRILATQGVLESLPAPENMQDVDCIAKREALITISRKSTLDQQSKLYLISLERELLARGLMREIRTLHSVSYEETMEYERYKKVLQTKEK